MPTMELPSTGVIRRRSRSRAIDTHTNRTLAAL